MTPILVRLALHLDAPVPSWREAAALIVGLGAPLVAFVALAWMSR